MEELVLVIVLKNVEMAKDLNLIVMMEIMLMVMDVHGIVKFNLDGHVLVAQAQDQVLALKVFHKEHIFNLLEQFIFMDE